MDGRSIRVCVLSLALAALALPAWGWAGVVAGGQDASPAAAKPFLGTITAIQGNVLTVKNDAGVETSITVPDGTKMVRTAPGQKTLAGATPIQVSDLQVGDRVLVKGTPGSDGKSLTATTLIAMKQADIAQKHDQEREDWQKQGTGGLVKAVDASSGDVTISVAGGAAAKTLVIHTSKATVVRRYAPDSVKFDDAKPAAVGDIKPGDQLRARGAKSADGGELTAEEIVAGTFRNVAGTVASVDAGSGSLTVMDLATKKPVVIKVTPDSQMRKLPEMMARGIATRLKGGAGGTTGSAGSGPQGVTSNGQPVPAAGGPPAGGGAGPGGGTENGRGGMAGEHRGGDLQQMLSRAPTVQLADLHKGDAVMVVTTEGASAGAGTAVTLLAGVEPLLQASPNASQSMLSASWNLGGGGGGGDSSE